MGTMSVKNFAQNMRQSIEQIKANGTAAVFCDNIIAYLKDVENFPGMEPTPADMERYKADLQQANDAQKYRHESDLEMFRSVIAAGQGAVRTSLILNGGAAVALLAFIGHLATCGDSISCSTLTPKIEELASSLLFFAFGSLAATVLAGCTYLSQWYYAGVSRWQQKTGLVLNVVCILLGLGSYGLFAFGLLGAYSVLSSL